MTSQKLSAVYRNKALLKVRSFSYDGFIVDIFSSYEKYKAKIRYFTSDPNIVRCDCSDGKERLIPVNALCDSTDKIVKPFIK